MALVCLHLQARNDEKVSGFEKGAIWAERGRRGSNYENGAGLQEELLSRAQTLGSVTR